MINIKKFAAFLSIVTVFALSSGTALAAPVEKTDGFVCPVIESEAVALHNPQAKALGDTGDYTIPGPHVSVPLNATNGDGSGLPGGPHSGPGDTDYTAVWAASN